MPKYNSAEKENVVQQSKIILNTVFTDPKSLTKKFISWEVEKSKMAI